MSSTTKDDNLDEALGIFSKHAIHQVIRDTYPIKGIEVTEENLDSLVSGVIENIDTLSLAQQAYSKYCEELSRKIEYWYAISKYPEAPSISGELRIYEFDQSTYENALMHSYVFDAAPAFNWVPLDTIENEWLIDDLYIVNALNDLGIIDWDGSSFELDLNKTDLERYLEFRRKVDDQNDV